MVISKKTKSFILVMLSLMLAIPFVLADNSLNLQLKCPAQSELKVPFICTLEMNTPPVEGLAGLSFSLSVPGSAVVALDGGVVFSDGLTDISEGSNHGFFVFSPLKSAKVIATITVTAHQPTSQSGPMKLTLNPISATIGTGLTLKELTPDSITVSGGEYSVSEALSCPAGTTGAYPKCICTSGQYDFTSNTCVAPLTCSDTDGGIDLNNRGTLKLSTSPTSVLDACITKEGELRVLEYYCNADGTKGEDIKPCPAGSSCSNGACVTSGPGVQVTAESQREADLFNRIHDALKLHTGAVLKQISSIADIFRCYIQDGCSLAEGEYIVK